jgi:1-acyl-sn-glycerol-3-phosphate acyltransferase
VYNWGSVDWSRDILKAAGTPVIAEGLERIPRDQPVIYVSNHSSMFDIWALSATLPGSVRFLAKQELFKIPLLGPAMRAAGHIPIDRAARKKAFEAYDEVGRMIRAGFSSPVVFPEGTRSRSGELLPFKNAPFGLAIAAQVPSPCTCITPSRFSPKGHGACGHDPSGSWSVNRLTRRDSSLQTASGSAIRCARRWLLSSPRYDRVRATI